MTPDVIVVDTAGDIDVIEVVGGAGPQGPPGPAGPASTVPGPAGPAGAPGPGVAPGGAVGHVLTKTAAADYATGWAAPAAGGGAPSDVVVVPNQWHQPPDLIAPPNGNPWPIVNRLYLTWFFTPKPIKVGAVAMNVTGAGGAGVVIRMAILNLDSATGLPTTVRYQGTVAGDSVGVKTLTVATPPTVEGNWCVLTGPQGSGAPGSTWLHTNSTYRRRPTFEPAPFSTNAHIGVDGMATLSGAVPDNPPIDWDPGNNRTPLITVRYVS
jgi:hypothetical protein